MFRLGRVVLFLRAHHARPETLLGLLIRAQDIEEESASMAAAFRAGLRLGLAHPELARQVIEGEEQNDR